MNGNRNMYYQEAAKFSVFKEQLSVANQNKSYSRRKKKCKHLGKISKPNKIDRTCLTVWVVYKDLNIASKPLLTDKTPAKR